MINTIDRIFCGLLALGTVGHTFGTFKFFAIGTDLFVWSLSGALASALLVTLNVLRNSRPADTTLRWVAFTGNLGWLGIFYLFGTSIGNLFDPRVLMHGVAALGFL